MQNADISFHVAHALLESGTEIGKPQAAESQQPGLAITFSREVGSQGITVAREIGRLLDWPVYDQEILDRIADELKQPAFLLRRFDERPASWLDRVVAGLASDYHASPSAYVKYLIGVVRGLGEMGRCIIVGRGSPHILRTNRTLRVYTVAAAADRARVVAKQTGLAGAEAVRWMEQAEDARREFLRIQFGVDPANAHLYDLVLNTSRIPIPECAQIVVQVVRNRESRLSK